MKSFDELQESKIDKEDIDHYRQRSHQRKYSLDRKRKREEQRKFSPIESKTEKRKKSLGLKKPEKKRNSDHLHVPKQLSPGLSAMLKETSLGFSEVNTCPCIYLFKI